MPSFEYEARDKSGKPVRGTREASDRTVALEQLRQEGLFLTRLEPQKRQRPTGATAPASAVPPAVTSPAYPASPPTQPRPTAPKPPDTLDSLKQQSAQMDSGALGQNYQPRTGPANLAPGQGLPYGGAGAALPIGTVAPPPVPKRPSLRSGSKDLSLYFRQLAALVHAGTSIGHGLGSMATNAGTPVLRQVSKEMNAQVMAGMPMSKCMQAYPGVFSALQVGMISAGERGGFLDLMLKRLANYAERDYSLQTMVKRETFYPKCLTAASVLIPAVVPAVLALVNGGGIGGMLWAWFLALAPWIILLAIGVSVYQGVKRAAPYLLHDGTIRELWDGIKLRVPIGGKVTRALATAKFCRALGALYSAGVGPGECVRLAAGASGNAVIARRTKEIIPRLEHGEPLTQSLASTGYFPGIAVQMMLTGEETGMLDEQLEKAADFMEQDCETAIKQSVQVLGVVAFLFIAGSIGFQVITAWGGYFNSIMEITGE